MAAIEAPNPNNPPKIGPPGRIALAITPPSIPKPLIPRTLESAVKFTPISPVNLEVPFLKASLIPGINPFCAVSSFPNKKFLNLSDLATSVVATPRPAPTKGPPINVPNIPTPLPVKIDVNPPMAAPPAISSLCFLT